jgi:hypothetical protein
MQRDGRSSTVRRWRSTVMLAVAFTATFAAPAGAVVSSTPDNTAQFNGNVLSVLPSPSDGRVFVGGSFSRAGTPTPNGADLSATDSSRNPAFALPNSDVLSVVSDGAGGWYIGGSFTQVGTTARNHVAHLLADGSVASFDPNVNGNVTSLILSGTTLYVGGNFSKVNGTIARTGLAAFDTTTGTVASFDPKLQSAPSALALSGTTMYVGGIFTKVNNGATVRNHLAAFDTTTTGTATSFDPNIDPGVSGVSISALAVAGGRVYAGGTFSNVNGTTSRPNLAAFDAATGAVVTGFNAGLSNSASAAVSALATAGGTLYIGGAFTSVNGGTVRNHVAALDGATGTATSFDPNIDDVVGTLVASGSTLYVGGGFAAVHGTSRNRIASVDLGTGIPTSFDPNVDSGVAAIAVSGGRVYAGGSFRFVGGATVRNSLAALEPDGTVDPTFNPNIGGSGLIAVRALAASGSTLYAAGAFTTVNGSVARSNIVALDGTTGAANPTFNPNADGTINALALDSGTLYAGGAFTTIGGASRSRLAGLSTSGAGAATAFNPSAIGSAPDQVVNSVAVAAGRVYAGGNFVNVGAATRNGLAAFAPATGALDSSFNPNTDGNVKALLPSGGTLYAGGTFSTVGGVSTGGLAALDPATGVPSTTFTPNVGGTVNALSLAGSTLYLAGQFTTVGGTTRNRLAAVDASSGALNTSFDPNLGNIAQAVATSGSRAYAGGNFTTVGGASRLEFAQFTDTTVSTPPTPVTGAASSVTATGASLAGTVNPNGAATTYTFEYGPTTSFGANTPFVSAGSGATPVPVNATLSGLAADTTYFYRVVAKDASGTSFFGAVMSFDTGPGGAPVVTTGSASSVSSAAATLAGTVNPHGSQTAFTFEYGTSFATAGTTVISAVDNAGSGNGALAVTLPISGLTPDRTYYYRIIATNASGVTFGALKSFNTGPGGAPIATTGGASSITATGAKLAATVDPHGTQTAFTFEYGKTTAFGSITAIDREDAFDGAQSVSLPASGLQPGTTYLYRVVATNSAGTTTGVVKSFTTAGA